jgi:hypothetical protein
LNSVEGERREEKKSFENCNNNKEREGEKQRKKNIQIENKNESIEQRESETQVISKSIFPSFDGVKGKTLKKKYSLKNI